MLDRLESSPKISVNPILKYMGRTKEEQLQKNQSAMELLRGWLEEEVIEEESKQRESYFESFKEIVDSGRLPGHKLYSQE
jgi:hypothetical protein